MIVLLVVIWMVIVIVDWFVRLIWFLISVVDSVVIGNMNVIVFVCVVDGDVGSFLWIFNKMIVEI